VLLALWSTGCSTLLIRKPVMDGSGHAVCDETSPLPWIDLGVLAALQVTAGVLVASRAVSDDQGVNSAVLAGGVFGPPAVLLPSLLYGFGRDLECRDLHEAERNPHPVSWSDPQQSPILPRQDLPLKPVPRVGWLPSSPATEQPLAPGCSASQIEQAGVWALEAAGFRVEKTRPAVVSNAIRTQRTPCTRDLALKVLPELPGGQLETNISGACGGPALNVAEEELRAKVETLLRHFLAPCTAKTPAPTHPVPAEGTPAPPVSDAPRELRLDPPAPK